MARPLSPEAPVSTSRWGRIQPVFRLAVCIATIFAVTAVLCALRLRDRPLSAVLIFLFIVLIVSALWGFRYAVLVSLIAAAALSWLIPPIGRFHISDWREVIALVAFLVIGITTSHLSARARRQALNANQRHAEAVAEQQRFRDLVNSVEGIVWEADAETFVFSFVSDQAERILGYPTQSWLNEPTFWKDHLHPEDRNWALQFCVQATAEKRSHDFEYRMIAADGRVVWLRDLVTVVVENGRATRLRGVMVDISLRKRAEEAARRSEKELRDVINTVPANVWSTSPDGAVDFVNQRWREFTGLSPGNALRWNWETAVHPEDRSRFVAEWRAALKNGQAMESEVRVRRGDGEYRWFFIRTVPVRDELGNVRKWYGTGIDIEDRKRAADSLRQTEAILSQAQRIARIGVWVTRSPMIPEYWSPTAFEIFGIDPAEGPPPNLQEFMLHVHPEDRERVLRETDVLETGCVFECKYRIVRPDGTIKVIREVGSPVQESGAVQRFVGAWMDITEQDEMTRELQRREAALQDSEEQWRAAFESNPTMYFMVDESGTILSVNPFGAEQLGYGPSELVEQPVLNVFYEPDRVAVRAHADKCFQQLGRTMRWEARKIRKDGTMLWVRETAKAVLLKKHPVLLVVCEDITEGKRAEQALRRSEAYLAEAQRLSHTSSWAFSPATMKMLYWSDESFRIWGFDPQQGLPDVQALLQRIHPEDRERMRELFERGFKGHLTVDVAADHRIVLPDGTVKYVHGISHPVFDEAGKVVEYVGTTVDVTERKRAEEALRRSEAYLAEAQRLTHTGSWAWNPVTEKAIYWSEETFRIFGLDSQRGSPPDQEEFLRLMHPEDRDRFSERVEKAFREKTDFAQDYRIVLADGTVKHLHEIGHPVLNETGDVIEYVGTEVDVTGRKRAEEEHEKLRQLEAELARVNRVTTMGELTASLAHEINQPIAAAVTDANTSVRWLASEVPNIEEAREAAKRAAKDATRAAEIIARIRSLFKKETPQREFVDLNAVIEEMVSLLRSEATRYGVSIESKLAAGLPGVMADRVQVQQVLMNLMLNSIDAMKGVDNPRKLTLTSQRDGTDQLLVSVSDTGIGLPPEAERIFHTFFTTKPHGTGMGLAISRTIIESHGGRLWTTSHSGPGAIFCFTLPTTPEAR